MPEVTRRPDDAVGIIAKLARRVDELERRTSRVGHGHVLGYAETNSNQGAIGGSFVALTGLSVDVSVLPGRRLRITGNIHVLVDAVSDTTAQLAISRAGVGPVQTSRHRPVGNNRAASMHVFHVETPGAGNHTYDLRLRREVGSGTLTMIADAGPAFILVEDIGPA